MWCPKKPGPAHNRFRQSGTPNIYTEFKFCATKLNGISNTTSPQFFWFEVSDPRYAFSVCAIATLVWNIHVFMRMPMRAILGIRAKWRFYAAVAALLIVTGAAWADPTEVSSLDPTGEWLVAKGWARIRIIDCNGRLWGVVSWEIYPDVDSHNPDSSKRSRPTLGTVSYTHLTLPTIYSV